MQIIQSKKIHNLSIIKTDVFYDFRGEYVETFNEERYQFKDDEGNLVRFVEDDISTSRKHILKGLHGDQLTWKLIQCLQGSIFVAVADMRINSPTYLAIETFELNDQNRMQLLIPAGCVNGHLCLSETCILSYKQSRFYTGAVQQISVRWNDPLLNIPWPVPDPVLSERDQQANFITP